MPKILDTAVNKIKANSPGVNPYAAATASLQKAGDLKPGTNQATKQGVVRGQMSAPQRQATPPAKTKMIPRGKPGGLATDLAGMAKK